MKLAAQNQNSAALDANSASGIDAAPRKGR